MSEERSSKIFVGTSGWSYDDWVGPFYPEKTDHGFSRLKFYSRFFDCVEVDSTFYRHFPSKVSEKWISEVNGNPRFVFITKLFKGFTHGPSLRDAISPKADTREGGAEFDGNKKIVLEFLAPFRERGKLGGVLVQFSEYFKDSANTRNYVLYLLEELHDLPLLFELRHTSWYTPHATEFLKKSSVNVIAIDQPMLSGMIEFNTEVAGTVGYIRLHGRNAEAWKESRELLRKNGARLRAETPYSGVQARNTEHWVREQEASVRYNYLYSNYELDEIEKKILKVKEKCSRIYVVANNHPMGKAVANALELVKRLRNQERVRMPDTMIKYFPELEKIAERVSVSSEEELF